MRSSHALPWRTRMSHPLRLVAWGLLVVACSPAPSDQPPAGGPPAAPTSGGVGLAAQPQAPDTTPPANVSHGEAPVGGPNAAPAPIAADLPRREHTRTHRLRLEIKHATVTVAPGRYVRRMDLRRPRARAGASRGAGRYDRLHLDQSCKHAAQHGLPRGRNRTQQVLRQRDAG